MWSKPYKRNFFTRCVYKSFDASAILPWLRNKARILCLFQNNLWGGEMLKLKNRGVSPASICIPNNISTFRGVFNNNHENKYFISILPQQHKELIIFLFRKNEVDRSVASFFYKTVEKAVPCCTRVILGM